MTQEEKQLLLKDLCARQFYGTKVLGPWEKDGPCELSAIDLTSSRQIRVFEDWFKIEEVKPYLRPMSSMTDAEREEWCNVKFEATIAILRKCEEGSNIANASSDIVSLNWLYERHFDCNNLIEQGLALEAPEGMYKTE